MSSAGEAKVASSITARMAISEFMAKVCAENRTIAQPPPSGTLMVALACEMFLKPDDWVCCCDPPVSVTTYLILVGAQPPLAGSAWAGAASASMSAAPQAGERAGPVTDEYHCRPL